MTSQGLAQAMMALLAASGIALGLSLFLLSRYRSKVIALMKVSSGGTKVAAELAQRASPTQPIRLEFLAPDTTVSNLSNAVFARIISGPARAVIIYGIGVGVFAAIMALAYLVAEDIVSVTRWLVMFVVLSWPAVIVAILVTPPGARSRRFTILVYAVTTFLVLLVAALISPNVGILNLHVSWLVLNAPPTLILFTFMNRRIRAVGMLTLIFALVSLTGAMMALTLLDRATMATSNELAMRLFGIAAQAGMSALEIVLSFVVIGLFIAAALGWLAVRWLASRYQAGRVSDQTLSVDATVLLIGIYHSIMLAYVELIFVVSGLVAFGLYRVAVNIGFGRAIPGSSAPIANLLYLRVFSLNKKSEGMFDAVTRGWRYVGNVQLIAGPDLATTTVEPHEYLDFISGRVTNAFIANNEDLDRRLASMESVPGRDLRYAVNDFFCYDNSWRQTLTALAESNSAVFLDARGFSQSSPGVVFELNELVNAVPLGQCVLAVDSTTDVKFLQQVVDDAWAALAADLPNQTCQDPALAVLAIEALNEDSLRWLLYCLSTATGDRQSA